MITVLLVYWAARSVSDSNGGLFAMLLMALSPSEIFMTSVLGSEVANSVFIIGAIAVMLSLVIKGKGINPNFFLLPGILLGVSVTIRPTSALILVAMIAYLMVTRSGLKDRLMNSGRMAAGLFIIPLIVVLWTSISSQQFSTRCLFYDSYPLLSGTNIKYKGHFNLDDAKLYVSIPEETRSAKVFEIARQRLKAVDFQVLSTFFSNKLLFYMSDNLYGSFWPFYTVKLGISFNQQFSFQRWIDVIAQTWYFLSLIGTSIIIVWFLVEKNPLWLLLSGTVLFSALPHTVFEVQTRYHHMLLPVFSFACGVMFWKLLAKSKTIDNHL
jgi:4-amino-4-deoxy-L-arabinose transferase-like glycosyltransferase